MHVAKSVPFHMNLFKVNYRDAIAHKNLSYFVRQQSTPQILNVQTYIPQMGNIRFHGFGVLRNFEKETSLYDML